MTATDDLLALYEDDPRTVSLYQLASALRRERAEVERLQAEQGTADDIIRHFAIEADPPFPEWTDDDWSDSGWTAAEAAIIRRAVSPSPTEEP